MCVSQNGKTARCSASGCLVRGLADFFAATEHIAAAFSAPAAAFDNAEAGYASSRLAGAYAPWRRGQMIREALEQRRE